MGEGTEREHLREGLRRARRGVFGLAVVSLFPLRLWGVESMVLYPFAFTVFAVEVARGMRPLLGRRRPFEVAMALTVASYALGHLLSGPDVHLQLGAVAVAVAAPPLEALSREMGLVEAEGRWWRAGRWALASILLGAVLLSVAVVHRGVTGGWWYPDGWTLAIAVLASTALSLGPLLVLRSAARATDRGLQHWRSSVARNV